MRGLRVLLAEDNELNSEIIKMLLTDRGAEVEVAQDGRKALEAFENHEPGTYAVIAMTANAFEEDAQKCFEAGMNAHLSKPIRIEKLVAAIAGFCGRGRK